MQLSLGPLRVTIKYTYVRGDTTIYQRAIPTDLRDRYPGKTVKRVLKTTDPVQVARWVSTMNSQVEAEWEALRASPESSPQALKVHAVKFLEDWGLSPNAPDNDPIAIELLHDHMDKKRERYAGGSQEVYEEAATEHYLSPVEREAGRLLHGTRKPTMSDALELYLKFHPLRGDKKFVSYQRGAVADLIKVCGDRELQSFKKADARVYVEAALTKVKTSTVRRRLNVFSAVFSFYLRENDLTRPNPFASLSIPGEGQDAKVRRPFTASELATLSAACRQADDPMRWILGLLIGTGARLAEVVGLPLEDIRLDSPTPHVHLQVHPWRNIKGAKWKRGVKDRTTPLTGIALWAAQRVVEEASEGQRFAFPQYTDESECKATSASGALNAWIRRLPLDHTCHELRHAVIDLLRDVQCPKDVITAITGHGSKDTGDGYGDGHNLQVKAQWLERAFSEAKDRD